MKIDFGQIGLNRIFNTHLEQLREASSRNSL